MPSRPLSAGRPPDLAHAPFLVIWEATRACDLVCAHCRAEAQPTVTPGELTTAEGLALIDHVRAEFGEVLFVFTGGDPLKRSDLPELVRHAAQVGLIPALTPSATPLLTSEAIARLHAAGLRRLAVSIDGADAATHDGFRGVPGTFDRSIKALQAARAMGLEIQINSSLGRHNRDQLRDLAALAGYLGVSLWSVFLLVPTGRADAGMLLTPAEHELLYRALAAIALDPATAFDIKTTAGQPYYRVLDQERRRRGLEADAGNVPMRAAIGVNDGKGFVFIDHEGGICPSGFLPLVAGNVRTDRLADIYRHHDLFVSLRDPAALGGKCGICEFSRRCGGSRSRTWALTGDHLAADPTCVYQPRRA